MIRTGIESYLNFAFSGFIALEQLSFDNVEEIISSALTLFFVVFAVGFPIFTTIFLYLSRAKLGDEEFSGKFESFYDALQIKQSNYLYTPFFLFRRLYVVLAIMYLDFSLHLQIAVLMYSSLFYLMFVIWNMPFALPILNYMEVYNESIILVSMYHCLCFTDSMPDPSARFNVGRFLISYISVNLTVNLTILIGSTMKMLF